MKRIRVLEIISGFAIEGPLGGIERFGIELARALDKGRIEPVVCGMWAYQTPYEAGWVTHLEENGIEAFMAAAWSDSHPYRSYRQAYQGTRQRLSGPVDIIHSHCQFGDGLALMLKNHLGATALVRTVHNEREWGKRPLRRLFLTNGLYPWRFDLEIGVAQQVVDNLNERPLARLLQRRAVKGYNALNLNRFTDVSVNRQAKKETLSIPAAAPVIGTIGRLAEQKGITYFLQAAQLVLRQRPDAIFLIVGDGELAGALAAEARELGIERHVIFTGSRADVEELLLTLDVFVNSSLWEGLPTVIMESMAAGVPVVATRIAGNLELIQDGETGLLVPPQNPEALALAIEKILALPPAARDRICRQADQFVTDHFSITAVARQHEELYSQLLR